MSKMSEHSDKDWYIDYCKERLVQAIAVDLRYNTDESQLYVVARQHLLKEAERGAGYEQDA